MERAVPALWPHVCHPVPHAEPRSFSGHYAEPLVGWLETFPAEQIHVIQFEELQENPEKVLSDLKNFLGMDPNLPEMELRNVNSRAVGGYPIKKKQYLKLLSMVQPDAEKLGMLLDKYGLGDGKKFVERWQKVWDGRLATCDENDMCAVDSNR